LERLEPTSFNDDWNEAKRWNLWNAWNKVVVAGLRGLDIPIHAFDLIIADECHRGYTGKELAAWRQTLDHFDAIKIGLTATPASHTTTYFKDLVYRYENYRYDHARDTMFSSFDNYQKIKMSLYIVSVFLDPLICQNAEIYLFWEI
jgi:Type III restriction enzyme, res subunit